MRTKIVTAAIAVPVVAGLAFFGVQAFRGAGRAEPDRSQTAVVRRGPLVATVNTAGTVEPAGTVDLAFQASGQVKGVKAAEGNAVKAGQEIACLDAAKAELQVSNAEASLAIAQVRLDQARQAASAEEIAAAQASLASAEESLRALEAGPAAVDIEIARLRWEQSKNQLWSAQAQRDALGGNPNASSASKDQAKASVASAQLAVEIARLQYEQAQQSAKAKELRAAEAQVAQARLNLHNLTQGPSDADIRTAEAQLKQAENALRQARMDLAQTCLTAPVDGVITRLDVQVGYTVGPSTPAGTLTSDSNLQVTANLPEVDVARVKAGQEAEITIDALPDRSMKGSVVAVAAAGTSTQGVVNYPATIRLDQADPAIKAGMTANVTIVVDRRDNVLLVPSRAIRTQGGQRMVRVLYQGQSIEVPVQIGLSGDGGTEILGDALKEGDVVLLNTTPSSQRGMPGVPSGGMMFRQ